MPTWTGLRLALEHWSRREEIGDAIHEQLLTMSLPASVGQQEVGGGGGRKWRRSRRTTGLRLVRSGGSEAIESAMKMASSTSWSATGGVRKFRMIARWNLSRDHRHHGACR